MESATVFITSLAALVIGITAYAIYVAFGPPSRVLDDPFEDHED
ncbi:MAG: photosystem II reaction center protein PsbN [Gloeomargarita sp. GMQP_bins_120]